MVDIDFIAFIVGGILGILALNSPKIVWQNQWEWIELETFNNQFPNKKKVYYLFKLLPYIWVALYILIFANFSLLFGFGTQQLFLTIYLMFGGFGFLDGILEIVTGVSPIRGSAGGRSGSLALKLLSHHESVRRFGFLRIVLVIGIGLIGGLIFSLTSS